MSVYRGCQIADREWPAMNGPFLKTASKTGFAGRVSWLRSDAQKNARLDLSCDWRSEPCCFNVSAQYCTLSSHAPPAPRLICDPVCRSISSIAYLRDRTSARASARALAACVGFFKWPLCQQVYCQNRRTQEWKHCYQYRYLPLY